VTALVDQYAELPLLFQRPLHAPTGQAVVVMLTPAAALFEGDQVALSIECAPGTDVTLVTVGATRLNRCSQGFISFTLNAHVAERAVLRYLPLELIPFRGTRYQQRFSLQLQQGASAMLLDVITPGRSAEPFTYTQLELESAVYLDDSLIARERSVLTPESRPALGSYSHYASLLAFGPTYSAELVEAMHATLQQHDVWSSSSLLPSYGVVLKALGSAAQPLRQALLCAMQLPPTVARLVPV
jgi:urease accessory protein